MTVASQVETIEPPRAGARRGRAALTVVPGVGWLLLFFVCPFLVMVVMSFGSSDYTGIVLDWTLRNYAAFFTSIIYPTVLVKTLRIAALTTILVLLIAYPLAYWLA